NLLNSLISGQDHDPLRAATYLLDQGAPINCERPARYGPLHCAALHGLVEIVRLLVERGANVDDRSFDGRTPLHQAAERSHVEIALELLACGADRDAVIESSEAEPLDEEYAELLGYSLGEVGS
ncbi:hypothetical protein HDU96_007169, partial [Phlyctochytrium bullatum]